MSESLSVVIITLNEEKALPACLTSVSFADEILVVDSGSSDATVTIAEQCGARVITQSWLGYGRQKQFAVEQAANDWVLCLDADEQVSESLQASIKAALQTPAYKAYQMPRCNRFMGRWLRHGEGYPDLSLRLFNRQFAQWGQQVVHERVETHEPVGTLKGDLLHESEETRQQYLQKQDHYTSLQAQQLYALGKSAPLYKLILNPVVRFVKFYFIRLGMLDGYAGFRHILIGCANTYNKYAKLRRLYRHGDSLR